MGGGSSKAAASGGVSSTGGGGSSSSSSAGAAAAASGGASSKPAKKVIFVGLDNSGKSTTLNYLKDKNKAVELVATVGFEVEKFRFANTNFQAYDMSGQGRYRNLWEQYFGDVHGIIFVVDSADSVRHMIVKDELSLILNHKDIANRPIPILFLANKQDAPRHQTPAQIAEILGLSKIVDRNWMIFPIVANSGKGVEEAMNWLVSKMA